MDYLLTIKFRNIRDIQLNMLKKPCYVYCDKKQVKKFLCIKTSYKLEKQQLFLMFGDILKNKIKFALELIGIFF